MRRIFADPFFKNSATAVYLHVCLYMNLSMVFFIFFQATLHGYVLSNETVDPIIPQLISVVRNDSLLTIPTTPVCSFNRIQKMTNIAYDKSFNYHGITVDLDIFQNAHFFPSES